jgi:hypothetical protein
MSSALARVLAASQVLADCASPGGDDGFELAQRTVSRKGRSRRRAGTGTAALACRGVQVCGQTVIRGLPAGSNAIGNCRAVALDSSYPLMSISVGLRQTPSLTPGRAYGNAQSAATADNPEDVVELELKVGRRLDRVYDWHRRAG